MADVVGLTISTFIASIFGFIGFLLGERTAKDLGHNLSEKILDVLKKQSEGKISSLRYVRKTGTFDEIENPDSTSSTPSATYAEKTSRDDTTA